MLIQEKANKQIAEKKKAVLAKEATRVRSTLISKLLDESLNLLNEADDAIPGGDMPMGNDPAAPPTPPADPNAAAAPPVAPPDPNAPVGQENEVTLEKVIAKLNTIRGGKSLRDPSIYNKLNTYYDGLQENEKMDLFKFLSGIAQVITDIVDAQQPGAMPPTAVPPTTPPPGPDAGAMPPPPTPPAQPTGSPTPIKAA